ncbi:hypothetical protein ACPPVS_01430 [Cellulomonas sp. McL0617]|uniref:hypothetical protein n=1 Tax=Cellulomonas sp. McL0617 TaxID=3415675 RepID=UPI003CF75141
MAFPQILAPQLALVEAAARGVIDAVDAARLDRRPEEPEAGLRVSDALGLAEDASENWFAATFYLEAALDALAEDRTDLAAEVQASRSALTLLHAAVAGELALLQPLEDLPLDRRIRDVPDWPGRFPPVFEAAAFGAGGLFELLRGGTDDDALHESNATSSVGLEVDSTVRGIVFESARRASGVLVAAGLGPLAHLLPFSEAVRLALEPVAGQATEWALDKLSGRISRLVRRALARARRLLGQLVGSNRQGVVRVARELVTGYEGGGLLAPALWRLFGAQSVLDEGVAQLGAAPKAQVPARAHRLHRLGRSNKRWLAPVAVVQEGLGPLWAVPVVPPVPAAPLVAAVLLAWILVTSGDQLDSAHFPDVWNGVIKRAQGQ